MKYLIWPLIGAVFIGMLVVIAISYAHTAVNALMLLS